MRRPLHTLFLGLLALALVIPAGSAQARVPEQITRSDLPTVAEAGRAIPTLRGGTRRLNKARRAYLAPRSCSDRVRRIAATTGREATYAGRDPIDSHKVLVNTARLRNVKQAKRVVRGWKRLLVVCPRVDSPQIKARFRPYRLPRMGQQQVGIGMRLRSGRINLNVVRKGRVVTTVLIFPSMRYTRHRQVVRMTRTAVRAWQD